MFVPEGAHTTSRIWCWFPNFSLKRSPSGMLASSPFSCCWCFLRIPITVALRFVSFCYLSHYHYSFQHQCTHSWGFLSQPEQFPARLYFRDSILSISGTLYIIIICQSIWSIFQFGYYCSQLPFMYSEAKIHNFAV